MTLGQPADPSTYRQRWVKEWEGQLVKWQYVRIGYLSNSLKKQKKQKQIGGRISSEKLFNTLLVYWVSAVFIHGQTVAWNCTFPATRQHDCCTFPQLLSLMPVCSEHRCSTIDHRHTTHRPICFKGAALHPSLNDDVWLTDSTSYTTLFHIGNSLKFVTLGSKFGCFVKTFNQRLHRTEVVFRVILTSDDHDAQDEKKRCNGQSSLAQGLIIWTYETQNQTLRHTHDR